MFENDVEINKTPHVPHQLRWTAEVQDWTILVEAVTLCHIAQIAVRVKGVIILIITYKTIKGSNDAIWSPQLFLKATMMSDNKSHISGMDSWELEMENLKVV